ncbi:hypothetical protein HNY73_013627 [Argiope bruennichi]|uniref:Uncharacterized protein n=1 Tax=Argiope bruennichi TaxID=94029 RepID=A0A8T0EZH4_ARGBR|nr:hypothetical protein HNY73_013627 [Argiope bruennichi]
MDVSALKAQRKELRTAFSLSLKKIESELMKEPMDLKLLSILKVQITDKFQRIDTCQNQVSALFLEMKEAEQLYLIDMEEAENYLDRYIEIYSRVDLKLQQAANPTKLKGKVLICRKLNWKKFSGEAKDFLVF